MKTISQEFMEEFKALLIKYDVEISIQWEGGSYMETLYLEVYGHTQFDEHEMISDSFTFNLGSWENGK